MPDLTCPAHGSDGCRPGDCPDYMAGWLLGACSSGDPLRRAVVLVVEEFQRRTDELAEVRTDRGALADALQDAGERVREAEDAAYGYWIAAHDTGTGF